MQHGWKQRHEQQRRGEWRKRHNHRYLRLACAHHPAERHGPVERESERAPESFGEPALRLGLAKNGVSGISAIHRFISLLGKSPQSKHPATFLGFDRATFCHLITTEQIWNKMTCVLLRPYG